MTVTIWHNPRCTKSRATLALLQEQGIEPEVRLYLQDAPSEVELRAALLALGETASGLVRSGEAGFQDMGLGTDSDDGTLIMAMAQSPKLIERPVVFVGDRAMIGRPPEAVLELFA